MQYKITYVKYVIQLANMLLIMYIVSHHTLFV